MMLNMSMAYKARKLRTTRPARVFRRFGRMALSSQATEPLTSDIQKELLLHFYEIRTRREESHTPSLKTEEELVLEKELWVRNLRLVPSLLEEIFTEFHIGLTGKESKYQYNDLVCESVIGLLSAIRKYDPARSNKLSELVKLEMRTYVLGYIRANLYTIKISSGIQRELERLKEAIRAGEIEELEVRFQKKTIQSALAAEDAVSLEEYLHDHPDVAKMVKKGAVESVLGHFFVDNLVNDTTPSLEDLLDQRKIIENWIVFRKELFVGLSPMEAFILRATFGLDDEQKLTLKEIGDKYHLGRERIRQINERTLCKIREKIRKKPELLDAAVIEKALRFLS